MSQDSGLRMPVKIGDLTIKNPFLVASGPTTKTVDQLLKAEECGWAGASLKLCFDPYPYINKEPRYRYWQDRGILAFSAEKRLSIEEGLELTRQGRKATKDFVIFANITYEGEKGLDGWVNMSKRFEDAGAHGIELNMCCPNMSFNVEVTGAGMEQATGASLGQQADAVATIVEAIRRAVSVPISVKLTPEGGRIAEIAKICLDAGADMVGTTANRLAVPPIDIENLDSRIYHLQKEPSMSCFCGPWLKPLALRDVYEMRKLIGRDGVIFGSGGCRDWKDAVEFFLLGADVIYICTETLVSGFGFMEELLENLKSYLDRHGHKHPREIRGYIAERLTPSTDLTIYPGHARRKNANLAAPCKVACPNHVPAHAYVMAVQRKNFLQAFRLITSRDPLQSVCGYICDHPCEAECTRGEVDESIRIRDIKRFVLEKAEKEGWKRMYATAEKKRDERVAVVGSGPAGISAAFDLARAGYAVTLFEAEEKPGGMLRGVIPAFRMPERILDAEIEGLESLGVTIETGKSLGRDFTVESLKTQGFDAVCLALGAQTGSALGVEGEDGCQGVVDALSFLKNGAWNGKAPKRVVVIGGGFTAIDAARTAVRLGAKEVFVCYRRTRDEMPATREEVEEAEEEGVKVMYLVSPQAVIAENGRVTGLRMLTHVLGEPDESKRRRPEGVEGTEFTLECDLVIPAVGQKVRVEDIGGALTVTGWGTLNADEDTGATGVEGVFAAGDCVTGPTSVIAAVASGRRTAVTIDKFLAGDDAFLEYDEKLDAVDKAGPLLRIEELRKQPRVPLELRDASRRKGDFKEYIPTMTEEEAVAEAQRCLNCGCGAGCQLCARICNAFAVSVEGDQVIFDEEKCHACGMCMHLCPNENIEIVQTSEVPLGPRAGAQSE